MGIEALLLSQIISTDGTTGHVVTKQLDGSLALESLPEVDLSAYLPLAGGTMTGQLGLNSYAKLGGVSAGVAAIYANDGVTLGTLEVNRVNTGNVYAVGAYFVNNETHNYGTISGGLALKPNNQNALMANGYGASGTAVVLTTPGGTIGWSSLTYINSLSTGLKEVVSGTVGIYQSDGVTLGTLQAGTISSTDHINFTQPYGKSWIFSGGGDNDIILSGATAARGLKDVNTSVCMFKTGFRVRRTVDAANGSYGFTNGTITNTPDTFLISPSSNVLAVSSDLAGTTLGTLQVAAVESITGSNLVLRRIGGTSITINSSQIEFTGANLVPWVTSAADIGGSSKRWRTGYFSTSVIAPLFDAGGVLTTTLGNATGGVTVTGPLVLPNGVTAAPSMQFASSTNTGILWDGANLSFTRVGLPKLSIGSSNVLFQYGIIRLVSDAYLSRKGTGIVAVSSDSAGTTLGTLQAGVIKANPLTAYPNASASLMSASGFDSLTSAQAGIGFYDYSSGTLKGGLYLRNNGEFAFSSFSSLGPATAGTTILMSSANNGVLSVQRHSDLAPGTVYAATFTNGTTDVTTLGNATGGVTVLGAASILPDGTAMTVGSGSNVAVAINVSATRTQFGYDGTAAYFAGGVSKTVKLLSNNTTLCLEGTVDGKIKIERLILGLTTPNVVLRHSANTLRVFDSTDTTATGAIEAGAATFSGDVTITDVGGIPTLFFGDANHYMRRNGAYVEVRPNDGFRIRNGITQFEVALSGNTTIAGILNLPASTTSRASINIPDGVAPTTPVDGDMWCVGDILYRRIGGVTKSLTFT